MMSVFSPLKFDHPFEIKSTFESWPTGQYSKLKWAVLDLGYEQTAKRIMDDDSIFICEKPFMIGHKFSLGDKGQWYCVDDSVDD